MPTIDLHFKYLLAAGLRENISLREIVFVNPDAERITERARQIFGEFERRPGIRIVQLPASSFITEAALPSSVWSIERRIHPAIQHVYHRV